MTSSVRPLSYENHNQIKIADSNDYQHAKNQQVVPLIVHEFARASAEMPIVFVKNAETGEFQAVALLGLSQNENLFYSVEKWLSPYLPALISHHPFALMPSQNDENQLQMVLKEDSHLVSKTTGDALFDDKGNETEYLTKRKNALGSYFESNHVSKAFTKHLSEKSLFSQQNLSLDLNGEKIEINGVYLVDEKALNSLADEDFLELRQKGYLAAIYSHLSSLHQLSRLAKLRTEK
jgi:hypothetical protein